MYCKPGLFRVWNPARGEYTNFSQDHCAKVWIGVGDRTQHNAITDAAISMSLFNAYRTVQWDSGRLMELQMATLAAPRVPGFSALFPTIDGCWYALFFHPFAFYIFFSNPTYLLLFLSLFILCICSMGNRKKCTCGAPFH